LPDYEDPFDDPNRPPLPSADGAGGFDHRRQEGETDAEFGQRYRKFLQENISPKEDPDNIVRPFGYGESSGSVGGSEQIQMLAEDIRRIRELLEGILNS